MNGPALRTGFVELLTEIRAAGPAASTADIERAFERCFPALVLAADSGDDETLTDVAQARILAAIVAAEAPLASGSAARRWPWLVALAASLLAAFTLWFAGVFTADTPEPLGLAPQPEAATFSVVTGEPTVCAPGVDRPSTAQLGQSVTYGSRVSTGDADLAELRFADGTTIRLGFNTTVAFAAAPEPGLSLAPRPREVSLTSGRILARVTHLDDEERFAVATPVATAEVLGTEFSLAVERELEGNAAPLRVVLEVRRGQVAFQNGLGRVLATDLMRTSASAGEAPTEPQRIQAFRSFQLTDRVGLAGTTTPYPVASACAWTSPPPGLASMWFRDTDDGRVVVLRVLGGSNAHAAGLRAGDEVRAIGGDRVTDAWSATVAVLRRPETRVSIQAARDGQPFDVTFLLRATSPGDLDDGLRLEQQIGLDALRELPRDREPARRALQTLIEREPHPAYWNNLGLLWQTDDRMGQAMRCFAEAVRLAPERELYHFNYGYALQSIGNLERATEELREAARLAPRWLSSRFALVDTLLLRERAQEAFDELVGLEQEHPEDTANILLRRSKAFLWLGRKAEAQVALEGALAAEPDSPWVLSSLSHVFDSQGRIDEAIRDAARAVELDPGSSVYANNLGSLYWRVGRYADAEPVLRRAIELETKDPTAHMNLGIVFQSLDRPADAEAEYLRAIALNPDYADTYSNYGFMLMRTPRVDEAEALLRKCLDLDPRNIMGCANLGSLLSESGRIAEAVALYREFLRVTPGVGTILNNLAELLAQLGTDLDEALDMANTAVAAAPQRPTRHHTLGLVRAARGELAQAEAVLLKALDLYGSVKDAGLCWADLGGVRERRGDLDGARDAYRKAEQLDPALEKARAALQRLGG